MYNEKQVVLLKYNEIVFGVVQKKFVIKCKFNIIKNHMKMQV
jgi:hypothetical protein